MLENTPLNSQVKCEFTSFNAPKLNDFGRLTFNEPYKTPSGFIPIQPVIDHNESKILGLYTDGIKTGK